MGRHALPADYHDEAVFVDGDGTGRKYKSLEKMCRKYSTSSKLYQELKKKGIRVADALALKEK